MRSVSEGGRERVEVSEGGERVEDRMQKIEKVIDTSNRILYIKL